MKSMTKVTEDQRIDCPERMVAPLDMDVDLARPEFDGRWDKQAVKQEVDPLFNRSKHWKTKMDKVGNVLFRTENEAVRSLSSSGNSSTNTDTIER